jgi:hypothetical protein
MEVSGAIAVPQGSQIQQPGQIIRKGVKAEFLSTLIDGFRSVQRYPATKNGVLLARRTWSAKHASPSILHQVFTYEFMAARRFPDETRNSSGTSEMW